MTKTRPKSRSKKHDEAYPEQISLFEPAQDNGVAEELRKLDISNMTPMDAMNTLYRLQDRLKKDEKC